MWSAACGKWCCYLDCNVVFKNIVGCLTHYLEVSWWLQELKRWCDACDICSRCITIYIVRKLTRKKSREISWSCEQCVWSSKRTNSVFKVSKPLNLWHTHYILDCDDLALCAHYRWSWQIFPIHLNYHLQIEVSCKTCYNELSCIGIKAVWSWCWCWWENWWTSWIIQCKGIQLAICWIVLNWR